jgi:hypothetical protein
VETNPPENGSKAVQISDLLHIYSHFQTDIENVKQRQWRDFNATLAGQGGLLFLSTQFERNDILFATFSFLLWVVGSAFLIENREVLEIYRTGKEACLKGLKKNGDISIIIDPPGIPIIRGKFHHRILSAALLITTALVICLLVKGEVASLIGYSENVTLLISIPTLSIFMFFILMVLQWAVPKAAKEGISPLDDRERKVLTHY